MWQAKERLGQRLFSTCYTRAGVFVFISNANIQRACAARKSNK